MKKKLISISIIFLIGCSANNDTLLQEQNELLQSKDELVELENIIASENSAANKGGETLIMDLTFSSGVNPSNGGCTFRDINYNGTHTFETTAAFGPNPLLYKGYTIRGYGQPRTTQYVNGLVMGAKNDGKKVISRGQEFLQNNPHSTAVSIEHPFEANKTYEIAIRYTVKDMISFISHGDESSESSPTIGIQLRDSPEIPGNDPCAERPVVGYVLTSGNYYRSVKGNANNISTTSTFNFSTTGTKNGLIIYFLPELTERNPSYVPKSHHALYIGNIKITQKSFDAQYLVDENDYRPVDDDGRAGSIRNP